MAFWNEDHAGVGNIDILFSTDNINFSTGPSGLVPTDNAFTVLSSADVFDIYFTAQFIRLNVSNCPQPSGSGANRCGIGEVAFETSAVPIPPAFLLFGSGLLGLAGMARRKKAA